jgi:hypothetical protein
MELSLAIPKGEMNRETSERWCEFLKDQTDATWKKRHEAIGRKHCHESGCWRLMALLFAMLVALKIKERNSNGQAVQNKKQKVKIAPTTEKKSSFL